MKIRNSPQANLHTMFTLLLVFLNISGCILIVILLTGSLQSKNTGHAQEIIQQTEINIISEEEAIFAAYKDAGVDNSNAKLVSCELLTGFETAVDETVYNISFKVLSNEYNYQISTTNGRILSYTSFYTENTSYQ